MPEKKAFGGKNVFPDNVHVFTEESLDSISFDELNTVVYGYAFTSPNMTAAPFDSCRVEDPSKINILLAHCDMLQSSSDDCPVTKNQIESFGCDYAALGHIHNAPEVGKDNRYAYCGCLEGRAFDELGPKGAVMVEIDKTPQCSSR